MDIQVPTEEELVSRCNQAMNVRQRCENDIRFSQYNNGWYSAATLIHGITLIGIAFSIVAKLMED